MSDPRVLWLTVVPMRGAEYLYGYRVTGPAQHYPRGEATFVVDSFLGCDTPLKLHGLFSGFMETPAPGRLDREVEDYDVVIVRDAWNTMRDDVPRWQRSGKKVLVDCWDNLISPKHWNEILPMVRPNTGKLERAFHQQRRKQFYELIKMADGSLVCSPGIVDVHARHGVRSWLCRDAIDPEEWAWYDYDLKDYTFPIPRRTGKLQVGFAGSPAHNGDMPLIEEAFRWAASSRLCATPRLVGGCTPDWAFKHDRVPFNSSPSAYRASQIAFDVALCPMLPDEYEFNHCRADNKVLELAMAGALPILSGGVNYEWWRGSGVLFAESADEFTEHVRWAATHRDEVYERALAVRELTLRERAFPKAIDQWQRAVTEVGQTQT